MADDNLAAAYNNARDMEIWHLLVKRTARLGTTKIRHKALTDTPCHYDSGRTTPTDTAYTLAMRTGPCLIGLGTVLWISIPATASMVAPKRTNKKRKKAHEHERTALTWSVI